MAHSNRNFAVAYLFLVALPVLGLVGVLRSGRSLTAPLFRWRIMEDSSRERSVAFVPLRRTRWSFHHCSVRP